MSVPQDPSRGAGSAAWRPRAQAYFVHVYTASGIVFALLATMEICQRQPDPRWVFLWLLIAVLIDATDGPLARRWNVKSLAAAIQGRTIDDIVDYLTFTFIPLLLVWRMQWVPPPGLLWLAPAMIASLLGFANEQAKQEEDGFFLGFPSYWNIYAFYAGLWAWPNGRWGNALLLLILTVLSVAPVRFIYPNLAPHPWRWPLLAGAALWGLLLMAMLPWYPALPVPLILLSLTYPLFYVLLSLWLDLQARNKADRSGRQ